MKCKFSVNFGLMVLSKGNCRVVRLLVQLSWRPNRCVHNSRARPSVGSSKSVELQKTFLHDFHVAQGGKMVPFAGWSMPVKYKESISASHLHTRTHASIFDVSHMLQTKIHGKDRRKFMESLTVADVEGLAENSGCLSLFTNDTGGILDDLIVNNTDSGYLFVVSNAGCAVKDLKLLVEKEKEMKNKGSDVMVEHVHDMALIAVQGPYVAKVLQPGLPDDFNKLLFMKTTETSVFGFEGCRVTRCGYTGEDGVEMSIPVGKVTGVVEKLLENDDVWLAGLGARDSLRLEAGLCLYGNDIDAHTTPIEASLAWIIANTSAETILTQLKEKPKKRRVGFLSKGPPARAGTIILDGKGEEKVGHVTSGCPSPCLGTNVSMGYVSTEHAKIGTVLQFDIRKKLCDATVSKMPFIPAKYHTKE